MVPTKQAIVLRLAPTREQAETLHLTMRAFNRGCTRVGEQCWAHKMGNKIALQPLVYQQLRDEFGLSSQMAVRAISLACEAYKADRRAPPHFDDLAPMILDARLLSFKGLTHVSLLCLTGRQLIAFRFDHYGEAPANRIPGQADLVCTGDEFSLHTIVELPV